MNKDKNFVTINKLMDDDLFFAISVECCLFWMISDHCA
jgi:hypothetical protein